MEDGEKEVVVDGIAINREKASEKRKTLPFSMIENGEMRPTNREDRQSKDRGAMRIADHLIDWRKRKETFKCLFSTLESQLRISSHRSIFDQCLCEDFPPQ